jgi:glycosyltransferase involved in cell wall biosynthesis
VGRLVEFKGQEFLLEALARLRPSFPQARLLVVGDGPRRAFLEQRARDLNVTDEVRFTGHREDVPDLLAAMEVFVLPSLAEDFGRVLLEAMAMQRPVVATAAGGAPEIVEDKVTGLLVPPANGAALAEAISALLADPARARAMGLSGRRRVEATFTADRHAALVSGVYADLVREDT